MHCKPRNPTKVNAKTNFIFRPPYIFSEGLPLRINSIKYSESACLTFRLISQIIFHTHLINLCTLYFSPIDVTFFHFKYLNQEINGTLIINLMSKCDGFIIIAYNLKFIVTVVLDYF